MHCYHQFGDCLQERCCCSTAYLNVVVTWSRWLVISRLEILQSSTKFTCSTTNQNVIFYICTRHTVSLLYWSHWLQARHCCKYANVNVIFQIFNRYIIVIIRLKTKVEHLIICTKLLCPVIGFPPFFKLQDFLALLFKSFAMRLPPQSGLSINHSTNNLLRMTDKCKMLIWNQANRKNWSETTNSMWISCHSSQGKHPELYLKKHYSPASHLENQYFVTEKFLQ